MRLILNKINLALVGLIGLLLISSVKAEEQHAVQTQTLLRSSASWDGLAYKTYPQGSPELTVLKITIPAHTQLPWHTHPMPNAAYVLSGEITVEKKENGEKKLLTAGQVLPEMVSELHRGITGNTPAVLIVFYAGTKDMPLSQH
ncbi:MAG: cupin domain-containing protein [Ottowia sp.]|nr:cupin domain-containing protein [Ottowia sp.]